MQRHLEAITDVNHVVTVMLLFSVADTKTEIPDIPFPNSFEGSPFAFKISNEGFV